MPFRPIVPAATPIGGGVPKLAPPARVESPPAAKAIANPPARIRSATAGRSEPEPEPKRRHHKSKIAETNLDENGDYIIGKWRPPIKNQWTKGQSGNARGPKPRKAIDPETALDDAILAEFATIANGEKAMTNLGLFALNSLKARAAQKDRKAAEFLLDLYYAKLRERKPQNEGAGLLPEEQAIIDALLNTAGWEEMPDIRKRLTSSDAPEPDDE